MNVNRVILTPYEYRVDVVTKTGQVGYLRGGQPYPVDINIQPTVWSIDEAIILRDAITAAIEGAQAGRNIRKAVENDVPLSPEDIADRIANGVAAYDDSAEEVGDPEGQPIIETFPQLREMLERAVRMGRGEKN